MRNVFLAVVAISLAAIAVRVPANAQVVDAIEANIPFGFTVRNKTLPAGDYTIKRVDTKNTDVMEIQSADGREQMLFMVNSAQTARTPERPELIFDRVGDEYFLSKVFEEGSTSGVELPKSRAERHLEKEGAMVHVRSVTVPGVPSAGR